MNQRKCETEALIVVFMSYLPSHFHSYFLFLLPFPRLSKTLCLLPSVLIVLLDIHVTSLSSCSSFLLPSPAPVVIGDPPIDIVDDEQTVNTQRL